MLRARWHHEANYAHWLHYLFVQFDLLHMSGWLPLYTYSVWTSCLRSVLAPRHGYLHQTEPRHMMTPTLVQHVLLSIFHMKSLTMVL